MKNNLMPKIPMEVFFKNGNFVLKGVSPVFEYRDGRRTDQIIGRVYTCLELTTCESIRVKVPNPKPFMTQEAITASQEPIHVDFINAFGRYYVDRNHGHQLAVSFSADQIINTKEDLLS